MDLLTRTNFHEQNGVEGYMDNRQGTENDFMPSKEDIIKELKEEALSNDRFLNGDGYLYHQDFTYVNDDLLPHSKKDGKAHWVFLIQLFAALSVYLLYLVWSYHLIPQNELLNSTMEFFMTAIN